MPRPARSCWMTTTIARSRPASCTTTSRARPRHGGGHACAVRWPPTGSRCRRIRAAQAPAPCPARARVLPPLSPLVHQTDWIVGRLCGRYDVTDVSTALKTGVEPARLEWPDAIESRLGIPRKLLPEVVLPGTPIGRLTAEAAAATGLPAGTPVVAGCTDGTAGCLASGARDRAT